MDGLAALLLKAAERSYSCLDRTTNGRNAAHNDLLTVAVTGNELGNRVSLYLSICILQEVLITLLGNVPTDHMVQTPKWQHFLKLSLRMVQFIMTVIIMVLFLLVSRHGQFS